MSLPILPPSLFWGIGDPVVAPCQCQEGPEPGSGFMACRWDQTKDTCSTYPKPIPPSLPPLHTDGSQDARVFPTLYSLPQLPCCPRDVTPADMHTLAEGPHQTGVTAARGRGWAQPHPRIKTAVRMWSLGKAGAPSSGSCLRLGEERAPKSKKEVQVGVASEESPKDSRKRAK